MRDHAEGPTFESVYETYADKVLNLVFRMTGDEDTARDLTQDIFVKVYENLASFEQRSSIYTWIHRIAVNRVYNYLKRERRLQWVGLLDKTLHELLGEKQIESLWSPDAAPNTAEDRLERAERSDLLWRAVRSLPPKYRVPIVLYHYEEMSYKEVAAATGLSESAVETRIHRGRKKLLKLLKPWIGRV